MTEIVFDLSEVRDCGIYLTDPTAYPHVLHGETYDTCGKVFPCKSRNLGKGRHDLGRVQLEEQWRGSGRCLTDECNHYVPDAVAVLPVKAEPIEKRAPEAVASNLKSYDGRHPL